MDDHFHLLRLRLLKPPPDWINLKPSSTVTVSLAVGVQDDYGVDLDSLGLIQRAFIVKFIMRPCTSSTIELTIRAHQ